MFFESWRFFFKKKRNISTEYSHFISIFSHFGTIKSPAEFQPTTVFLTNAWVGIFLCRLRRFCRLGFFVGVFASAARSAVFINCRESQTKSKSRTCAIGENGVQTFSRWELRRCRRWNHTTDCTRLQESLCERVRKVLLMPQGLLCMDHEESNNKPLRNGCHLKTSNSNSSSSKFCT